METADSFDKNQSVEIKVFAANVAAAEYYALPQHPQPSHPPKMQSNCQTTLPNLKNLQNFPNQEEGFKVPLCEAAIGEVSLRT